MVLQRLGKMIFWSSSEYVVSLHGRLYEISLFDNLKILQDNGNHKKYPQIIGEIQDLLKLKSILLILIKLPLFKCFNLI